MLISETIQFIKKVHSGQVTKAGEDYWTHPYAVMQLLPDDASIDVMHAALLHDVLEDTETTEEDLKALGYSNKTIEIVKLLTRPKTEPRPTYMEWIRSIADSGNICAIQVKLADNKHNSDPFRIASLPPENRDIVKRYRRSMRILEQALLKHSKVEKES